MFGNVIETSPKFYVVPSPTQVHDLKVKVTDLECLYKLKFCVIFFLKFQFFAMP